MNDNQKRAMRDVLIESIYQRMLTDERIYFLSADFGSPALDALKTRFGDRFKSVGIAEQNLLNIATGLALEGFTVFAYAIAPFLSMRAYEQIRTNLSLQSFFKDLNVNIVGVGTGLSYDVSGPTHHCLEDITLMRLLPHIDLFSPSDWSLTQRFLTYCLEVKRPKYLRLDSKPVQRIYTDDVPSDFKMGFAELSSGDEVCIVSTGYMTHTAINVARILTEKRIKVGVIDLFLLKSYAEEALYDTLKRFAYIVTLEEAFILRGGMDALIATLLSSHDNTTIKLLRFGISDTYVFESGGREHIHRLYKLDEASIVQAIKRLISR